MDEFERMQRRLFNIELHFTLVAIKLSEIIEQSDAAEEHENQLAQVMESFLESCDDLGSNVTKAMELMADKSNEDK